MIDSAATLLLLVLASLVFFAVKKPRYFAVFAGGAGFGVLVFIGYVTGRDLLFGMGLSDQATSIGRFTETEPNKDGITAEDVARFLRSDYAKSENVRVGNWHPLSRTDCDIVAYCDVSNSTGEFVIVRHDRSCGRMSAAGLMTILAGQGEGTKATASRR